MLATRLRGGDASHNGLVEQVDRELKDADAQLKEAQEELEYVIVVILFGHFTTLRI